MECGPVVNHLSEESSPYLLLHAHNPVDWYPWSAAAIERARTENKPIFLSIGYSTCYWCHVMERESFSDPAIAERMNRDFVNIKVDREERPDIDEIYMAATQILTQQGGWPNSLFLTPDLKPFFAGTYFPPEDRHGLPSFSMVLGSLSSAWADRRDDVNEQAASVAAAMSRALELRDSPSDRVPSTSLVNRSVQDLRSRFDSTWGGFGGAPKFPSPSNLLLLKEVAAGHNDASEMLEKTLGAMGRGGIHDQVGGGFHRYSTDREWLVPHFEKMLYDNGLLLETYAGFWKQSRDPEIERIVRRTVRFLHREMIDPTGGLWSAIDAETDGHEGAYYVWTDDELRRVLGEEDVSFLAPIFGFSGSPTFEGKFQILHLSSSLQDQAKRRHMSFEELDDQTSTALERLFDARASRSRPATDDKILADWNGMAIAGLAVAGDIFGEKDWIQLADSAAKFVLSELRPEGALRHSWRGGKLGPAAFLSDYVFLVHGLLALAGANDEDQWLQVALELTREQIDRLADPNGGFYVAAESDDVLFRSKEVIDGAVPGANAVAVLNLVDLFEATRDPGWLEIAEQALRVFGAPAERHPAAFKTLALATKRYHEAIGDDTELVDSGEEVVGFGSRHEVVTENVVTADLTVYPGDTRELRSFRLHVDVAPGWHLYAPGTDQSEFRPVRLVGVDVELLEVTFPEGKSFSYSKDEEEVAVYLGCFEILGEIRTGGESRGSLRLEYQACEIGRCLAPAEIELPIGD